MNERGERTSHPHYVRMLEECEADEALGPHRKWRSDVVCPECLNWRETEKENREKGEQ